ncbi:MAG: photosystem II protein PsbQ [Pleurocapsa minor HA4230-MV1]|jgi:photosystem II protein PsbQ|nr:photosystem II protein PsbQ [Pleurocapsa minor HA4230-MV1]
MKIFRPILSLILVLATTLLVSCGAPAVSTPPTYTPEKLEKISTYRIPLDIARQRIPELGQSIVNEDWVNANSFLHGPLGLIRRDLTYLSNALLPDEQEPALNVAKDIFKHLENIDAAVSEKNYTVAINQYKEVVSDLDLYNSLIPQTKEPEPAKQAMKEAENTFAGVKAEVEETIEQFIPDFNDNA